MTNYRDLFTVKQRDEGADGSSTYVTLVDSDDPANGWIYAAVMEAHDGEMPNDWRWNICADICEAIDDLDKDERYSYEIANQVGQDCYAHDLLAWIGGNLHRMSYVDEAIAEHDPRDLSAALMTGQELCIRQMAETILQAVIEHEADIEDDDDE